MNDPSGKSGDERDDDLAPLFGRVAARARPRPDAEAAAFAALHATWRSHIAARRRHRIAGFAAAAVATVVTASLVYVGLQSSAPLPVVTLATIEHVEGTDVTWRDDRSQAQALGGRTALGEGQRLATGPQSRIALRWHDGGSLRLDAQSRLEFVSAGAVRLTAGSLYFDSGTTAQRHTGPSLAVHTPAGEVVHIGTQFMVKVARDEVVLSVREGQVRVTADGFELVVIANETLDLRGDGSRDVGTIDGHGEPWTWAAEIAPPLELDGRSAFDILAWVARETGRGVVYDTPSAEARARANVLRGIDRRSPQGALTLLPHLTELYYEIRDEAIVVSVP